MKNKKILFGLALIASFTLCSCGSEFLKTRGTEEDFGVIELPEGFKEDNPKQGDTEDSVHYIVKHELENVNGGYDVAQTETLTAKKGEKTNALPKKYTGYEPQEVTQVDVALDGSTVVHIKYSIVRYSLTLKGDTSAGTFAGEGKYKVSEGQARLIAKPYIGYEFIGWYIGDTLLSNKLSYSLTLDSDIEVRAEFKVLDEFKDYIFESTENSCKLTGLCIDYKSVLNVPEGVTEIAADAFEDKYVRFVNMPTTLKHIESGAFYECRDCIRITINSDITVSGYPFGYTYEVLNLGNTDLSGYVSEYYTYRSSESDPTEFHIDEDGFIFRVYENYMHQTVCTLYGNINELEEIHLPESFTLGAATFDEYNIERYAFVGLTPRILYIPESVSSIESYAFTETKNLAEIFNLSSLDIEIGNSTNGGVSQYAKIIHNNQSDDKELVIGEKYDYYLEEEDGITYAIIVNYHDVKEDLVIDKIENYPTIIGNRCFCGNNIIETVTLNEGVVGIGNQAFDSCYGIRELVAPYVLKIGENAFTYDNLKTVDITNCEVLEYSAFAWNYALQSVKAEKLKYIGSYAFQRAFNLYQFTVPSTTTEIADNAFSECYSLLEVVNHSNLGITQGDSSFGGIAENAISVINKESDSIYSLDNGFVKYKYDGTNYMIVGYAGTSKDLVIPANANKIKEYAFVSFNFDSIKIGNNIISIEDNAFYSSKTNVFEIDFSSDLYDSTEKVINYFDVNNYWPSIYVDAIIIDGELTEIKSNLFNDVNANIVVIPGTVSSVGSYSFEYYRILDIYFGSSFSDFISISSAFFDGNNATNLYLANPNGDIEFNGKKYEIADVCVISGDNPTIESYQFDYYPFKKVIISEGVTRIEDRAFYNCLNLEEVVLPSTLTYIGYSVFGGCEKLSEVTLKDGLEYIDSCAFYGTAIKTITIPSSVTYLGSDAFEACRTLVTVTYNSDADIPSDAFANCVSLQSIRINGNVESIGSGAFTGCKSLHKITLPDTITSLGRTAFSATSLKELDLSNLSITSIPDGLCQNCAYLTTVKLPSGLTEIKSAAFKGTKLKTFDIPSSIIALGNYAFQNCSYLESVTISGNPTLGISLFSGCRSLKTINLPDNITKVPACMFADCTSLSSITIPEGVTEIEASAFEGCTYLERITLPDTITDLGSDCFKNCNNLPYQTYGYGIYLGDTVNPYKYFISPMTNQEVITVHPDTITLVTHSFISDTITKVIIPATVEKLPMGLFTNCKNLVEIQVPYVGDGTSSSYFNYLFDSKDANIPSSLKKVTINGADRVPQYAFKNVSTIETVVLGETVTSVSTFAFQFSGIKNFVYTANLKNIYQSAFSGCTNLESIDLSLMDISSSGSIGTSVFSGCTSLENVVLPTGISTISANLFDGCTSLSSVTIPETVTSIGNYAFYQCPIAQINIPNSCTTLGNYAFSNNKVVESITIPSSITSIPSYCFYANLNLKELNLPDSVTEIKNNAFQNCDIRSLVVSANITSIGNYAFNGNKRLYDVCNLSSLTITAGETGNGYAGYYAKSIHTDLSNRAFFFVDGVYTILVDNGNAYLIEYNPQTSDKKDVVLPSSFTYDGITYDNYAIDSSAFTSNKTINVITIPESVTEICKNAFNYASITGIVFEGDSIIVRQSAFYYCTYLVGDITLPSGTYEASAFSSCNSLSTVTFKNGATTIGNSLFANCYTISSITLPEGLTSIGNYAFQYCSNLTHMDIPASVKTVGDKIFYQADQLKTITFKEGSQLEEVGISAFANRELKDCDLPQSLKTIGQQAFSGIKATRITLSSSIESIDSQAFEAAIIEEVIINCDTLAPYIFRNCKSLNIVTINGNIRTISEQAFYGCESLSSFTIPASVIQISSSAFATSGLETITIPSTVVTIQSSAFSGCESLISATIEANITTLQSYIFSACYNLESVTLPNSITTFNERVFRECHSLETINLPTSLQTLGNYSFYGCYKLNNVVLNEGITSIPTYCFAYCKGLTSIELPSTLTTIGDHAFYCCETLPSFNISSGVDTVKEYAFSDCKLLSQVTIPNSVTTIERYAFASCGFETFTMPETVTSLGNYVLSNNANLISAYIYSTSLQQYIFYRCSNLEFVVLSESIGTIPYAAFNMASNLTAIYTLKSEAYSFSVNSYNNEFTNATKYYYSETEVSGYWHFDTDGKPVIWE